MHREDEKYIKILVGKPVRKSPPGRRSHRREENARIDLNRLGRCVTDSPGPRQGPATGSCEHDNEPGGSIKGGEPPD